MRGSTEQNVSKIYSKKIHRRSSKLLLIHSSLPLGLWTVLPGWLPPPVEGFRGALGSWFELGSSASESLLSSSPFWVSPPSVWQQFELFIWTTHVLQRNSYTLTQNTWKTNKKIVIDNTTLSTSRQSPPPLLTNFLLPTAVRHIWFHWLRNRGFWDLEELHSPKLRNKKIILHALKSHSQIVI